MTLLFKLFRTTECNETFQKSYCDKTTEKNIYRQNSKIVQKQFFPRHQL